MKKPRKIAVGDLVSVRGQPHELGDVLALTVDGLALVNYEGRDGWAVQAHFDPRDLKVVMTAERRAEQRCARAAMTAAELDADALAKKLRAHDDADTIGQVKGCA